MAAVAGSKGRINLSDNGARPSFQAQLSGRLLSGELTADLVADELLANAQLREVGVDTNMICNLKCSYCYLDDRPESKGKVDAASWSTYLKEVARFV